LSELFRIATAYILLVLGLSHPSTTPGTASVGLSLVGCHQVGLLTPWEAAEKSPTLLAAEERLIDI
jgi:hypothetical protein